MTKQEIKKASNSELIMDYIRSYSRFTVNLNLGLGLKRLGDHLKDLDKEMIARGILSQDQIDRLNA